MLFQVVGMVAVAATLAVLSNSALHPTGTGGRGERRRVSADR